MGSPATVRVHQGSGRRRHLWAMLVALSVMLAACSGDPTVTPPDDTSIAPPATASSPAPTSAPTEQETETAEDSLDYYDGETLTILLPVAPGGSNDVIARFLAEWLPRYFVGDVAIVVENMPGGGQLLATNHYHLQVLRDGLTAMVMSTTPHQAWRFGMPRVEFDLTEWEPLMTVGGGKIWVTNPELSGIETLEDLVNGDHEELFSAGQAVGGGDMMDVMQFHMLDVDVQVTWGYESSGDGFIAFERGETNLSAQSSAAYPILVEPLIESGQAINLFTMGKVEPDGTMVRDPSWPDVPTVAEVYEMMHGEPPSGPEWDAIVLSRALGGTLGRVLWMHADAPEPALAALRHALEQAVEDPEFMTAITETTQGEVPIIGQEARDLAQNLLFDASSAAIEFIVDYAMEQYEYDMRS